MITLITDISNNDLYLDDKNNIAISKNDLDAIKQLVNNKLQTFLGEISIDLNEGVDYFGTILDKFIPLETKISELTLKILQVDGVIGINNIDYSPDKQTGQINFDISIQTNVGSFNLQDLTLVT